MEFSQLLAIILGGIMIYLIFLILGFKLRKKNINAQKNIKNQK